MKGIPGIFQKWLREYGKESRRNYGDDLKSHKEDGEGGWDKKRGQEGSVHEAEVGKGLEGQ